MNIIHRTRVIRVFLCSSGILYSLATLLATASLAGAFQSVSKYQNQLFHKRMSLFSSGGNDARKMPENKQLLLIRHGCSYMNEYIGSNGVRFGGPNFTDVFNEKQREKYQDSPLSPKGQQQAKDLHDEIGSLLQLDEQEMDDESIKLKKCLMDLELVVVSPLTRAIQTAQLGLLPHLVSIKKSGIPTVAQPLAAERLYLVSDIGKPRTILQQICGEHNIDFESCFPSDIGWGDPWWYQVDATNEADYREWRPTGQGQRYSCPGEPPGIFEQRMKDLCCWLDQRDESKIALVAHFGVFEWLLQNLKAESNANNEFGNCEMKVVDFASIFKERTKSA